jgi:hypothetical protein
MIFELKLKIEVDIIDTTDEGELQFLKKHVIGNPKNMTLHTDVLDGNVGQVLECEVLGVNSK